MKLEIGINYSVLFSDGSVKSFKFVGGNTPKANEKGVEIELVKFLEKPFLAYWSEGPSNPFEV